MHFPKTDSARTFLMAGCITLLACCQHDELVSLVPQDGLVADIALDGNGFDRISNLEGMVHNAFPFTNRHGQAGRAMYFNRSDSASIDFADQPQYSFTQNIFSVSCWVLVADTSSPSAIMSKRMPTGPWEYSLDNHMNSNVFNFDNWIADGSTTVYGSDPLNAFIPVVSGGWRHIVFVADGILLKAYLNGTYTGQADTLKGSFTFSDTDAPFQIGTGGGYGRHYHFDGAIDDVLIYNRVLTEQEIELLSAL